MAKASILLRPAEARDDGRAPLYLVIRHSDRRAVLSLVGLGIEPVRPSQWNARLGELRSGAPGRTAANDEIARVLRAAHAAINAAEKLRRETGAEINPAQLRDEVRDMVAPGHGGAPDEPGVCFASYSREMVAGYEARGQYGTWESYRAALDKLLRYVDGAPGPKAPGGREWRRYDVIGIPFETLTPRRVRLFYDWLLSPTGACNRLNTARKAVQTLRTFHKRAIEDAVTIGPNPWMAVTPKSERARKRKLTTDELRAVLTADIEPGLLRDVRDWFGFAFYAGGMRFGDVATLRREHLDEVEGPDGTEWRVSYRMGKTEDLHGVVLTADAVACLDRAARDGWRTAPASSLLFRALKLATTSRRRRPGTGRSLAATLSRTTTSRRSPASPGSTTRTAGRAGSRSTSLDTAWRATCLRRGPTCGRSSASSGTARYA